MPRHHPRNLLNDLTGRDWLKFTKSWFICDSHRGVKNKPTELHPARFPEEMVAEFLQFFTQHSAWVLDPFCGSGATLIAALEQGRHAVGLELNEKYVAITRRRLPSASPLPPREGGRGVGPVAHVLQADARQVDDPSLWSGLPPDTFPMPPSPCPQFDFLITSPPYFDMLHHPRGGVKSTHQRRIAAGLDQVYSPHPADLGNLTDYAAFLEALGAIFDRCRAVVKPGKYMVVVVQNLRAPGGEILPLAWDLARRIGQTWLFQGERIWCQNSKRLGIWGYPSIFVPNYHHHYCLIFRHVAPPVSKQED
jgi:DNA modification methylase